MADRMIVGTAGWSIPARDRDFFATEGSALERYAGVLAGAEINSSFYRSHRASTWGRWAASVPPDFRFSVKLPKSISHERKLVDCRDLLEPFLAEAGALGGKLGVLLLQLPPKLAFDRAVASDFFGLLRASTEVQLVCEPRHASWFEEEPDRLLDEMRIARVAADPAPVAAAADPGGWRGFAYWRLHGSPAIYRSPYGPERLGGYAGAMRGERQAWCILDNTASSAAMGDALVLAKLLV